ncbi:MAG: cytochrome c [Bdellovibrionota bacterium]
MKFIFYFLFFFVFSACTKKPPLTEQLTPEQLVERGKSIYTLNCIACHNADPSLEGTAGPAIRGASLDLLQAKILNATYPASHKPKRDTKLMPKMAHLEKEIPALSNFLR